MWERVIGIFFSFYMSSSIFTIDQGSKEDLDTVSDIMEREANKGDQHEHGLTSPPPLQFFHSQAIVAIVKQWHVPYHTCFGFRNYANSFLLFNLFYFSTFSVFFLSFLTHSFTHSPIHSNSFELPCAKSSRFMSVRYIVESTLHLPHVFLTRYL